MAERLSKQVERLAQFIMDECPGEPSQSEGAVDTAIRLLREGGGPSRTTIGDRRLTWAESEARTLADYHQAEQFVALLFDLDRCEHGRHEGDGCNQCGGPSKGNPLLSPSEQTMLTFDRPNEPVTLHARQLGFDISGRPICFPEREAGAALRDPRRWVREREPQHG